MSEREISRKTTLENKIFIILLYFWRTLIDRVADMMRVSIKLNVKCVSLQFQSQWDEKTDEIDRDELCVLLLPLCPPLFLLLLWDVTDRRTQSDIWQRNTTLQVSSCCLSPPLFPFLFFFFSSENLLCRQTHTLDLLCQPCETRVWLDDARLSFLCSP